MMTKISNKAKRHLQEMTLDQSKDRLMRDESARVFRSWVLPLKVVFRHIFCCTAYLFVIAAGSCVLALTSQAQLTKTNALDRIETDHKQIAKSVYWCFCATKVVWSQCRLFDFLASLRRPYTHFGTLLLSHSIKRKPPNMFIVEITLQNYLLFEIIKLRGRKPVDRCFSARKVAWSQCRFF